MIIESTKSIDSKYTGNIVLKSNSYLKVSGMVAGNITVENNSTLEVSGMVTENICIEPEGRADISGMVNKITNQGYLTVSGVIGHLENHSENICIKPNAIVNGQKY
ncbi:hypothetical protein [Clostridium sp. BNL1100]|uniref:hypothetical protein n=1 Tax=Clostridium sp. BNL1100 TaxID=755731 RepID=UPI00024A7DC7|nr:hypothetical protein [Clostridium sp. BNL1100]AEY65388.1 hypothetical protein Clo1100_1136 [Clostridium sp. BNL1100]